MRQSIGIDIGATKIMFGLMKNQKLIKKRKIKTPKTKAKLVQEIKKNLKAFLNPGIKKIGLGIPGILDYKKKKILICPNLKYLNNFNLAKLLEKEFKIKVIIENDANCFTLAEALLGAGKNKNVVLGITLGSGLGAGLVINKKIYHGSLEEDEEIGHQTIDPNGYKCSCGKKGCLECYASAKFFKRKGFSSRALLEKARQKNKKALKIFREFGEHLGMGLKDPTNIIKPEIIVVGGGISKAWPYFLKEMEKELKKQTKIEISKLGETAGAIGAALITH